MKFIVNGVEITFIHGDITDQKTEAIVNSANHTLMGGGGVDGAIHRKGGLVILEECRQIRATLWPQGLPTGNAVLTSGGKLKAKYVIHTVGPIWDEGNHGEQELLEASYWNSLKLAVSEGIRTISFPSISTGSYRYPIEVACRTALLTIKEFLEVDDRLDKVVLVLFTKKDLDIYKKTAKDVLAN